MAGNLINRVFGDLLLVDQEVVGFERELVGNLRQLLQQLSGFAAVFEIQFLGKMNQLDRTRHSRESLTNFLHIRILKQSHVFSLARLIIEMPTD